MMKKKIQGKTKSDFEEGSEKRYFTILEFTLSSSFCQRCRVISVMLGKEIIVIFSSYFPRVSCWKLILLVTEVPPTFGSVH